MASNWIKVEVITPDKPEIFKLAEILNIDPDAALGKAIRFWVWADQQTIDGNADSVADNEKCNADSVTNCEQVKRKSNAVVITKSAIDRICFMQGFSDALIQVGWLAEVDGVLILPNFDRHNGESSKKRALTNKRVSKARKSNQKSNANNVTDNEKCNADSVTDSVTKALPEEEEEEDIKDKRNKNIMSGAEQVLPQTAEEVFISLPLADGRSYFDVTESYFAEQVGLYPGINIEQEFRNMRGWLDSNPKKRKTPKGIKRFITTWLQNSQDKPRGKKAGPAVHRDVNGISQPGTTIPSGFRG
ncbi:hypothetical protein [Citrobacter farmeri]|uniref:hypothetical protein n=1 Tax=Citrobacter farmeri TaxID=67824 RepID=UPI00339BB565